MPLPYDFIGTDNEKHGIQDFHTEDQEVIP